MSKSRSSPSEGSPDGAERKEVDRLIDQTARENADDIGKYRALLYWTLGLGGGGLALWNTPEIIKQPVLEWAGVRAPGKGQFDAPTAKERIARARPDAKAIVDRIIAQQPRVELQTVTDEAVRERVKGILADKQVSPEELWVLLSAWQQRELVAIARRYNALDNPNATDPATLRKRLPRLGQAADHLAGQLRAGKGELVYARWSNWVNVLNDPAETADQKQKVRVACTELRAELVDEGRTPFASDVVVTATDGGGIPLNAKGKARLVAYEKELLGTFVLERHALIDQAETYGRTLQGVKRLHDMQAEFRDTMKANGMNTEKADARVRGNEARKTRIDATAAELARVVTVIELRTSALADPAWKDDSDKALAEFFGGKDKIPAVADVVPALRNARIRAMDNLRAELNNDHPDWVEGEKILRALAYTLPAEQQPNAERKPEQAFRGDPAAVDRDLRAFLERTAVSQDSKTQQIRAILAGLAEKRPMTAKDVQAAYGEMKKGQEMPFSTGLADTVVEWAGQHEATFYDPREPYKRRDERDRFAKSRQDLLRGIVRLMAELENLRSVRIRAQSGFSAVQNGVAVGADPDTQWVLDPQVAGDLGKDLREQSKQGVQDVRLFLAELKGEHGLKSDDLKRDAAAAGVRVARTIINVFDRLRGMQGQTASDTARMRDVVLAFDEAPLRHLEESYDALLAYLEDPQSSPEQAVADRRAAKTDDIEAQRTELGKKPLNRKEVQELLRQKLTPAQRLALRMVLEDQRQEAAGPFLNEETANLLALAALSDEGGGKLGDIQQSRDSVLQTILFVLGILAAVKGFKGRAGLMWERWGARNRNRRVLRAYEEKRAGMGPPPVDEKAARAERRAVLENINKGRHDNVRRRMTALQATGSGIDFQDVTDRNAANLRGFAVMIRELVTDLRSARTTYNDIELQPDVNDRVRLRVATEDLLEQIEKPVRIAAQSGLSGPSIRHLDDVYQAIGELHYALRALEPDLPVSTPRLQHDTDIDAANTADVLLLACAAGLDIESTAELKLREQLKRKQTELTPPATT